VSGRHVRPRWVTGTIVVVALIAIAFVVVHLTVGSPFDHTAGTVGTALLHALR
jgi:hypothetical protein